MNSVKKAALSSLVIALLMTVYIVTASAHATFFVQGTSGRTEAKDFMWINTRAGWGAEVKVNGSWLETYARLYYIENYDIADAWDYYDYSVMDTYKVDSINQANCFLDTMTATDGRTRWGGLLYEATLGWTVLMTTGNDQVHGNSLWSSTQDIISAECFIADDIYDKVARVAPPNMGNSAAYKRGTKAVMVHEIGHAIGIGHSDESPIGSYIVAPLSAGFPSIMRCDPLFMRRQSDYCTTFTPQFHDTGDVLVKYYS